MFIDIQIFLVLATIMGLINLGAYLLNRRDSKKPGYKPPVVPRETPQEQYERMRRDQDRRVDAEYRRQRSSGNWTVSGDQYFSGPNVEMRRRRGY